MKRCRALGLVFLFALAAVVSLPARLGATGTLTALKDTTPGAPNAGLAPGPVGLMLLLPDGRVMASDFAVSAKWYMLTPDGQGHYAGGKWSTLGAMFEARRFISSVVMRDGRVFVAGGEYGTNGTRTGPKPGDPVNGEYLATAEIYTPGLGNTGTWARLPAVPAAWSAGGTYAFGDSTAMLMPDDRILIGPVYGNGSNCTLYDIAGNYWIDGPVYRPGTSQNEATWVKLKDGSVLTIDQKATTTERYIPSATPGALGSWVADASLPQNIYDPASAEIGAALLLPSGKALFLGANGKVAIYTPANGPTAAFWTMGASMPNVLDNTNPAEDENAFGIAGSPDAPAAMLTNGKVLCALARAPHTYIDSSVTPAKTVAVTFGNPTYLYEYDPVADSWSAAINTDPKAIYQTTMLDLPDGTVLYSDNTSQLLSYQPDGTPLAAGKPRITNFTKNPDGTYGPDPTYHLVGKGLNGLCAGAGYGDDSQMDTNYPIVRLTGGGNVYYARTFNWSSVGVATGETSVTTEFALPSGLPGGSYALAVIANGIASDEAVFSTTAPAPAVAITSPANNAVISQFPVVSGTATDNSGPGIAGNVVDFTLYHVSTSQYWNGSGWGNPTVQLSASLDVNTNVWTYNGQLPSAGTGTLRAGQYLMSAYTYDNNGVVSPPVFQVNNISFAVDTSPPMTQILAPANGSNLTTVSYSFNGSITDNGEIDRVVLFIRRQSDSFYWNGSTWVSDPLTANLSSNYVAANGTWTCSATLPTPGGSLANGNYDFIALGFDKAGNTNQADSFIIVDYHPTYVWTGATLHDSITTNDSPYWGTPENWSPNGTPGPGDIAIIDNGDTVQSTVSRLVYGLRLGGNSSLGNYLVEVTGPLGASVWASGTLGNEIRVDAGAGLTIDTTNSPYLYSGGVINNAGTVVLTGVGGILQGAYGATINNTGSFLITREGAVTQDNTGSAYFNNLSGGTLVKTAGSGAGTATVQWILNNGGTVESDSGTLAFSEGSSGGGGSSGVFLTTVAAARIGFSGGTHLLNAGATFRGPGRGQVSSGLVRLTGASTVGQAAPAVPAGGFEVIGSGSMDGGGSLSLVGGGGTFAWSANGTIGTTVAVGAGSALSIDTTNSPYLYSGGVINNAGTAVLTGGAGVLQGAYGATINNTGRFLINRSGAVTQDNTGSAFFNNLPSGMLVKTAGSGAGTATVQWILNNSGTVQSDSGTLAFSEGSSSDGGSRGVFLTTVAAARIGFSGGTHLLNAGATFRGPGRGQVSSGGVRLTGASTVGQASPAVPAGGFEVIGTGNMDGGGSLSLVGGGGTFAWSSNGQIATTVAVGAGSALSIDTTNSPYLYSGGVINNAGTAVLTGGAGVLQGAYGATINNTGSFLITREGPVTQDNTGSSFFNNLPGGTLAKTAGSGAGTATVQWILNNGGTVKSDSGTLAFSEGSSGDGGSSGVFLTTVAAARIGFSGGTHLLNAGATFRGPGRGQVSDGRVRLTGASTVGQASPAVPAGGFEVIGTGNMDGGGSLSLVGGGGTFAWSSNGQIATTVSVGAGSELSIDTTNSPYLYSGGVINNAGTAVLTGGAGVLQGAYGATINNTGSFLITREGPVTQDNTGSSFFNNLPGGTLAKTADSGAGTATVNWILNNGGTVKSDSGTLAFSEGSSGDGGSSGVFLCTVATARIGFSGGTHLLKAGATFRGPGRGQVSSGGVRLMGACTVGQASPAVPAGGFEVIGSGSMDGAGSISLVGGGGTFAWSANGTIGTTVSVGAGSALSIDTTNNPYLYSGGVINNAGNAVLFGVSGILQGGYGATINNTGSFFINRSGAILQDNTGNSSFHNQGTVSLLPTASLVTMSWAYSQTATGTLNLKIGGTNAALPQFDRFQSSAGMTLDGTLNLSLINSFVPTMNDAFAVLTYGSHTGTFAKVNVLGAYFSRSYNPNDFTLTAVNAPTNFAEWKAAYFDPGSPDADDNADPDHDGLTNLLEYATGGNPLNPSTYRTSYTPPAGGFAYFTYTRSKIAFNELQFQVEYGNLTGAWSHVGVTEKIDSDDGSLQHVTAKMPAASGSRGFAHLLVTKP